MRYGLFDRPARKLADVGVAVGLTQERVRQLQKETVKALQKHLDDIDSCRGQRGSLDSQAA